MARIAASARFSASARFLSSVDARSRDDVTCPSASTRRSSLSFNSRSSSPLALRSAATSRRRRSRDSLSHLISFSSAAFALVSASISSRAAWTAIPALFATFSKRAARSNADGSADSAFAARSNAGRNADSAFAARRIAAAYASPSIASGKDAPPSLASESSGGFSYNDASAVAASASASASSVRFLSAASSSSRRSFAARKFESCRRRVSSRRSRSRCSARSRSADSAFVAPRAERAKLIVSACDITSSRAAVSASFSSRMPSARRANRFRD